MNLNLAGKNAMVCGSTQGIGKASAMALAALGANVTLVARNADKLKQTLSLLKTNNEQKHDFLVADFQDPESLKQMLKKHLAEQRAYHILINNTGGPPAGPIFTAEVEAFESAFSQHLKCNHILVQALVPAMKEAGYGRIVNVISTSVKEPIEGLGVSNTIRAAVANWSKTLAGELGSFGITVNNVLPGFTATERLNEIVRNISKKLDKSEEDTTAFMKKVVPLKRFAQPEEIANAVVFLCSEAASYINGVNLPVDGGRTKSL